MSPQPRNPPNPEGPRNTLDAEIGEDWIRLLNLSEADLELHEQAVNAHSRNSMTVRGFAITAVAALVAATYATHPAAAGTGLPLA